MARNDLWIIGDDFVNNIYHALPAMNMTAKLKQKEVPYIYNYFNVKCFTSKPLSTTRSVPAHLVNCLIKALNEQKVLPRIIAIIPDWDILKYLNHNTFGIEDLSKSILLWMIKAMTKVLEVKKDRLFSLKPGALNPGEPKVIWAKMINRHKGYDDTLTVRRKFNTVLENLLVEYKHQFIMDLDYYLAEPAFFNANNMLNEDGMYIFWREFNHTIKKFEKDKKSLQPQLTPTVKKEVKRDTRFRMPLPPPPRRGEEHRFNNHQFDQSTNRIFLNKKFLHNY